MTLFNGWKDAPHHWKSYLSHPVTVHKGASVWIIRFFGFVLIKEVR